jgi:hypothetical protein
MRKSLTQSLSIGCISLAIATGLLPFAPVASARTLVRAQGRCKLTSQSYQAFNGHCTVKQKEQADDTTAFIVELDNGSSYRFFGRNKQALQVETHEGVHNVRYNETPDKGVFDWQEGGNNNRLSVKVDSQNDPNANHDTPTNQSASTTVAAVVVGSLITSLLGGNTTAFSPSPITSLRTPDDYYREIDKAYVDILGRSADRNGSNNYYRNMRNGWTITQVRQDLANSAESAGAINKVYLLVLGRNADPGGLQTQKEFLVNGGSLDRLRSNLANSDEARSRRR